MECIICLFLIIKFTADFCYLDFIAVNQSRSGRGVQHYVIHVFSDLRRTVRWFSLGTPVSSANKTDRHDITEILLKVALNTIKANKQTFFINYFYH
jgi:hypothetical protein